MSESELGAFIRSRRESITPSEVGLPHGPRRRTPGLRRAELATIAGISVDYLIRLEQGRDRHPSGSVVAALADALRLGDEDRIHLKRLAAVSQSPELCPSLQPPATSVRPMIRRILERLEPNPALVLNDIADALAWTAAYEPIGGPLGILDDPQPNLIRFTFTDPRAREVYPEWATVADEQVANLRAAFRVDDPHADRLVADLHERGGDEFTRRWEARPVARKGSGIKRITHPDIGELRLAYETMDLADAEPQRLVMYLPADDATEATLDQLAGRYPGGLHAVERDRTATA